MRCSGQVLGERVPERSGTLYSSYIEPPGGWEGASPALLPSSTWNRMAQPWCRKLGRRRSQELEEEEEGREATWLPAWRDRWLSQVHAPVPQLRQQVHYQEHHEPGTRPPSRSTEQHCGTQGAHGSS